MKVLKVLLPVALLITVFSANAQKNIVKNPGFEDELYEWNGDAAKVTPWVVKSGKGACVISALNTNGWVGIDQVIDIPKKAEAITIGASIKADNVVPGKDDWNGGVFLAEFLDKAGKKIGDATTIARIREEQGWTNYEQNIKLPPGAVRFKLMFALGNASGTMLIDDVVARVTSTDQLSKL